MGLESGVICQAAIGDLYQVLGSSNVELPRGPRDQSVISKKRRRRELRRPGSPRRSAARAPRRLTGPVRPTPAGAANTEGYEVK